MTPPKRRSQPRPPPRWGTTEQFPLPPTVSRHEEIDRELAAEKLSRELDDDDERGRSAPPLTDHEGRLRTLEGHVNALRDVEPRVRELERQIKHLQSQGDRRARPPRRPE